MAGFWPFFSCRCWCFGESYLDHIGVESIEKEKKTDRIIENKDLLNFFFTLKKDDRGHDWEDMLGSILALESLLKSVSQ